MTRRVQTLLSGLVVLCVLVIMLALVRVPYVALIPGPTVNTLGEYQENPVIVVEGITPNSSDGNLNLTTLGVVDQITIFQAISGWFSGSTAVVPREVYYPPTQTREQTNEQNRAVYVETENAAIHAAMNHLGYPHKVVVVSPPEDSPIVAGDAIEAIEGQPVASGEELAAVLETIAPGTSVTVDYLHHGEPASTQIVTIAPPPSLDREGSLLGVVVNVRGYGGFTVTFPENDIGGPSAGLMLTLGIIDLVADEPLVSGEFVAGTGTITADGEVGPIGGVRFKIMKAAEVGADLFLTPAANCAEAMIDPPEDAPILASVETLQDAIDAIEALQNGTEIVTCS